MSTASRARFTGSSSRQKRRRSPPGRSPRRPARRGTRGARPRGGARNPAGLPLDGMLAVGSRTASGDELLEARKAKAQDETNNARGRVFIVVVPQEGGHGHAARRARTRVKLVLDRLRAAGLFAAGMVGD